MAEFFYILIASLLGIVGHWVTRWVQGRTQCTFMEYLMLEKGRTMSSVFSVLSSTFVIYSGVPDDLSGKSLILLLGGAYSAAYTLDSKINKEGIPDHERRAQPPIEVKSEEKPAEIIKEKIDEDKNKSLDDLLADDKSV